MFKLLLTLLLLCGVGFSAEPRVPGDLKVSSSIVFKEVDGQKLDLILFQPLEKKFEKAPLAFANWGWDYEEPSTPIACAVSCRSLFPSGDGTGGGAGLPLVPAVWFQSAHRWGRSTPWSPS